MKATDRKQLDYYNRVFIVSSSFCSFYLRGVWVSHAIAALAKPMINQKQSNASERAESIHSSERSFIKLLNTMR